MQRPNRLFFTLFLIPLIFSGCTKMLARHSYRETIRSYLLQADQPTIRFIGSRYDYFLKIPNSLNQALRSINQKTRSSITFGIKNYLIQLDGRDRNRTDITVRVPSEALIPYEKNLLSGLGFHLSPHSGEFWAVFPVGIQRREKGKNVPAFTFDSPIKIYVYEHPSAVRRIVALLLKPVTYAIDIVVLIFGLLAYGLFHI